MAEGEINIDNIIQRLLEGNILLIKIFDLALFINNTTNFLESTLFTFKNIFIKNIASFYNLTFNEFFSMLESVSEKYIF